MNAFLTWLDSPFSSKPINFYQKAKIFGVNLFLFTIVSILLLYRNREHILFTGDLYHVFINMVKQLDKTAPLSQTLNLLVYGNVDYGINARLIPAFNLARWMPDDLVAVAVYTGFSIEVFVSVFLACWLFRLPTFVASLSAWTACLAFLPYGWPYMVWVELSIIIPGLYTASAVFILFTGLFYNLGKGDNYITLLELLVLSILSVYIVLALLQFTVLIFFMLGCSCLGAFLVSSSWKERRHKFYFGLLIISIFWIFGIFKYIESYYSYNWVDIVSLDPGRPQIMPLNIIMSILNGFKNFDFYQSFHIGRSGMPARFSQEFTLFCLGSTFLLFVFLFKRRDSSLYKFIALFLITLGGYLTWQWAYLEAVMAPLWAIIFSLGVFTIYRLIGFFALRSDRATKMYINLSNKYFPDWLKKKLYFDRSILFMLVLLLAVFSLYHFKRMNLYWPAFHYGKEIPGDIFRILKSDISLSDSSAFNGRLANISRTEKIDLLPDGRQFFYEAQQNLDHDLAFSITKGADYRHSAMVNNIPTFFDVNRFIAPGTVATMNYFMTDKRHYKQAQFLYPSKFDMRWMAFFGIRYVINNRPISGASGPLAIEKHGEHTFYLYKILDPNIGNYSPTKIVVAETLHKSLELMQNSDFDFRKSAVSVRLIDKPLVEVRGTRLILKNGQISLSAESVGWSLLVLPFEYSNCLKVSHKRDNLGPLPSLHRINNHQIGVLFEKKADITISFDHGLLSNSKCRGADITEWRQYASDQAKMFQGVDIRGGPVTQ